MAAEQTAPPEAQSAPLEPSRAPIERHYVDEPIPAPGWLGLALSEAPNSDGAVVTVVFPRGPAYAAGLRVGDVIAAINDERIENAADLETRLRPLQAGASVRLMYLRDGARHEVAIVLAARH